MEITVMTPETKVIHSVRITVLVEYGDEDMPTDFPGRNGILWMAVVRIETGDIYDWPRGRAAKIHMKVVDNGTYELLDPCGTVIACRENDYVPGFFPGNHYGDYLIFDIDGDGKIAGWKATPERVAEAFFPSKD